MAFTTDHVGEELLESINRPFRALPDLLDALMRALAERTPLVAGSLRLDGIGALLVRRGGRGVLTGWHAGPGLAHPAGAPPVARALALEISYAGELLGELRLQLEPRSGPADPETALLRHFARHCGLLVKRYAVRRWSEQRLGHPLLLVGMSKALRELEDFLEISARGRLPVLLRGEFGTEKAQLAATLHCCGPSADGPFVQIDCTEPGSDPAAWVRRAEGGTLFLSDVDELDSSLQKQLPQHLPSRQQQWLAGAGPSQLRVIASTTADLHARAQEGLFSRALLAELDFLTATIPPLRDRLGDIEPLICHALERNGYRAEEKSTEALIETCRAHHWPENLFELERTIARLAVMTEARPIQPSDIRRHAPDIAVRFDRDTSEAEGASGAAVAAWVRRAIGADETPSPGLHDGLGRALAYLGAHYDEPITLAQLARHAGVSPSHMGYLFRTRVGMPFKVLLGHIRIQKARELLAEDPASNVTEIALRVGYADLSHFERRFRRIVGQSPREFRRAIGRRSGTRPVAATSTRPLS